MDTADESTATIGKVAYIVSRFPKLTETFVLYEILAVEGLDVQVELYPLQRERVQIAHPEAVALQERANNTPLISLPILQAHLHFLARKLLLSRRRCRVNVLNAASLSCSHVSRISEILRSCSCCAR